MLRSLTTESACIYICNPQCPASTLSQFNVVGFSSHYQLFP